MAIRKIFILCILFVLVPAIASAATVKENDIESYTSTTDLEDNSDFLLWGAAELLFEGADSTNQSIRNHYNSTDYPATTWGNFSSETVADFYIDFWMRINNAPASGGSKNCKIFGETNGSNYANTALKLHNDGGFASLGFGDGSGLENDTQVTINLDGSGALSYHNLEKTINDSLLYFQNATWKHISLYMRYNTDGNYDGEYKVWVDDDLKLHVTNVKNRHDDNIRYIEKIELAGYGGHANSNYDHPFDLDYDQFFVGTHRRNADIMPTSEQWVTNETVGDTKAKTFTYTNNSTSDKTLSTSTLDSPFSVKNDNCDGQTVSPGGSCTVDIEYSPSSNGTSHDVLHIGSGGTNATLAVYGTGLETAESATQVYFEDDFEDQTYTNWDFYWNDEDIEVNSERPHNGTYSAEFHYVIPAGGSEHKDTNIAIMDQTGSEQDGIDVMHFRAYLNIKDRDTSDYTWTNYKLFYVYSQNWDSSSYDNNQWDAVLDFVLDKNDTQFTFGLKSNSYSHYSINMSTSRIYNFNQWYCIELGIGLNELGKSDGWIKLWIDGDLVLEKKGITFRTDIANDYKQIGVGYQVNRTNDTNKREGYRYWDDFIFASDYIGPFNGTESATQEKLLLLFGSGSPEKVKTEPGGQEKVSW